MNIASSAATGAITHKLRLAYPLMAVKLLMGIPLEALVPLLKVTPRTLTPASAPASCQVASR